MKSSEPYSPLMCATSSDTWRSSFGESDSAGNDLDENDIAGPLRIVVEQLLQRTQLLDDTLDHIELVPADNDLLALVQRTKRLQLGLDTRSQATEAIQ